MNPHFKRELTQIENKIEHWVKGASTPEDYEYLFHLYDVRALLDKRLGIKRPNKLRAESMADRLARKHSAS